MVREFGQRVLPCTGLLNSRVSLVRHVLGAAGTARDACSTYALHPAVAHQAYHAAQAVHSWHAKFGGHSMSC